MGLKKGYPATDPAASKTNEQHQTPCTSCGLPVWRESPPLAFLLVVIARSATDQPQICFPCFVLESVCGPQNPG